jgi:hypothetical protein
MSAPIDLGLVVSPEAAIAAKRELFQEQFFTLVWQLPQPWSKVLEISLSALARVDTSGQISAVITDDSSALVRTINDVGDIPSDLLGGVSTRLDLPVHHLKDPLALGEVHVAKPWGRERWFTGIEARGVCDVAGTPLPWLLSFAPRALGSAPDPAPILLKMLEPHAHATLGDLYFEAHEEKAEVYVVTGVAPCWPDGKGEVRLGFDPERVATAGSPDEFRRAYLQAVVAYQRVRDTIDEQIDARRSSEQIGSGIELPPSTIENWLRELPQQLLEDEESARHTMEAFSHRHTLEVGDTVTVPPLVPHALQHGVSVVEFQSPHYERYILSFNQQVLTQVGWDTERAIDRIRLDTPAQRTAVIQDEWGVRIDEIANFEHFHVHRVTLAKDAWLTLDYPHYYLAMGVEGDITLGQGHLLPECARWVPACCPALTLVGNTGKNTALIAIPH